MSPSFTPPPISSWQGPAKQSQDSGQFVPPPISSWQGPSDLAKANQAFTDIEHGAPYRFMGRIAENLNPVPLLNAAAHPIDTTKAILSESGKKATEAAQAVKQGEYGRAALSAAEAVPLVGPMVSQAEQDIQQGNYAGLAGTAASLALPGLAEKTDLNIPVANSLNPVERSAVTAGTAAGVPIDVATATGNRFARSAQELMAQQPFTASRMARLRNAADQGLEQWGRNISGQVAPTPLTPAEAGEEVTQTLQRRMGKLDKVADTSYGNVRTGARQPQNAKQVQVGTTTVPGPNPTASLTPAGMPVSVPQMATVAAPTDITQIQAQIQPILDRLEKTIPEAQKQASPGLSVLRQIAARPPAVDLETAISDLSSIQNIARTRGELPEVRGISKGLAASVIPTYRAAIDTAAKAAGVLPDLNRGRLATKSKYAINDVLNRLPDEPAQVFGRLTAPGDKQADLLADVKAKAPATMPSIARTFVEGLVDNMSYQGDIRRAQSAVRAWQGMGDRTKQILFPNPAVRQNITDFVNLAEMMTRRVNPSGTGATLSSILGLWHPQLLAAQIVAGTPIANWLMTKGAQAAQRGIHIPTPGAAVVAPVVGANVALPKQQSQVPAFAKGGIVRKKTIGLVGEAGPEAIVPVEQLKKTPQGRETLASLPEVSPVERSSALPIVPERPDTLQAQIEQLSQGKRRAVMFPRGTPLLKRPKGMKSYQDGDGNTFIYHPSLTSQPEIDRAAHENRLTDLLGATHGGMGSPDKSQLHGNPPVVTGKDAKGTPVQSSATDNANLKRTVEQTKKVTPKGGSIEVAPAEKELERRAIDRVRGSIDVPLDDQGKAEADELGKRFAAKGGVDRIISSDLTRGKQTTAGIVRHNPKAKVSFTPNLRPWPLGGLEGQPTEQALPELRRLVHKTPGKVPPGRGQGSTQSPQSFDQFKSRYLKEVLARLDEHDRTAPNEVWDLQSHKSGIRLMKAFAKKGAPGNLEIDKHAFFGDGDKPTSVFRIKDKGRGFSEVQMKTPGKLPGGLYISRHGSTSFNAPSHSSPAVKGVS